MSSDNKFKVDILLFFEEKHNSWRWLLQNRRYRSHNREAGAADTVSSEPLSPYNIFFNIAFEISQEFVEKSRAK